MARKYRKKKNTNFYPESVGAYDVGYGKLPSHSKYKKGDPSPYPSGRPKGSKNKRSPDRIANIIDEEGERMVSVKEQGKLKDWPTDRAIVRSINVAAINGNQQAQKLAMELMVSNANKKRDERNARFEAAVDYKNRWAHESKLRRQRGEPDPKVYPHPDDFLLDFETSEVLFVGAMSAEQEEYCRRILNGRKYYQTAISELIEEANATENTDDAASILEDLVHFVTMLRIFDRAIDAWAEEFYELPDWDRIAELKDKIAKETGLDL